MNASAPAYSVKIATIITLMGYTLAGYPASVFAQAETTNPAEVTESTTAGSDAATTTDPMTIAALSSASPYPIEKLMSDRVYSDFVVGPGMFNLEVAPGQSKTVEIVVTNRMGVPKTFSLSVEDMTGSSDANERSVVLLGDERGPYSIKDYVSVPQKTFVLNHAERTRIPVTVSLPADAEPGGFYGSLLTQIVSDETDQQAGEVVPSSKVVSRIGTLLFVSTPGEIQRQSELVNFSTRNEKKFYTKGPIEFNLVTENTGSVHVTPFGSLSIYNTLGNEVGYVELQPWYVLPKSLRNKEVQWNREFMVGRYTAVAEINRGYENITDTVKYTFWVIPLELIAAVFGSFFMFFLIIRFFFSRFEFKRKGR